MKWRKTPYYLCSKFTQTTVICVMNTSKDAIMKIDIQQQRLITKQMFKPLVEYLPHSSIHKQIHTDYRKRRVKRKHSNINTRIKYLIEQQQYLQNQWHRNFKKEPKSYLQHKKNSTIYFITRSSTTHVAKSEDFQCPQFEDYVKTGKKECNRDLSDGDR